MRTRASAARSGGRWRRLPLCACARADQADPAAYTGPFYPTWYRRGDIAYGFHAHSDLSQAGSEFGLSDMDDT